MDDETPMRAALAAALEGPEADPNPRVGCVIVAGDGGDPVVGRHLGAGTPHAEVDALARAGERARGSTAYVTLEPCTHHGRTGPCAQALVRAGVRRVVVAVADPNPVAGGGCDVLRAAGVEVVEGVLGREAAAVNATWLFARHSGRPWVVAKTATSLDGRVAAADGSSRWITGVEARADAHRLRARSGAVVVGTGTALADDPHLTVRTADGTVAEGRQPVRVVVGLRPLPPASRVLDAAAPTLHLRTRDPRAVLERLCADGVHRVLLEGGPGLTGAFLRDGLVDEVVAYLAPVLLGAGPPAVGDLGITAIGAALRLEPTDVTTLGRDVRVTARPVTPSRREESP